MWWKPVGVLGEGYMSPQSAAVKVTPSTYLTGTEPANTPVLEQGYCLPLNLHTTGQGNTGGRRVAFRTHTRYKNLTRIGKLI